MAPIVPPPPGYQPEQKATVSQPPPPPQPTFTPIVPYNSTSNFLIIKIVLRALTVLLTFISLIILTTNSIKFTVVDEGDYYDNSVTYKLNFHNFISYRYMLFTILLGLLYSILQLALTIFQFNNGKRISNVLVYVDFFGDLVLLYALATGASAGFAVGVDMGGGSKVLNTFFAKANATASMLFLGSVCSAGSLVFSAFGLEHRL